MKPLLLRLTGMLLIYLLLRYFGGSFGQLALYPVTLLVAFLHELGHAAGAVLTGGDVLGLQVNLDGSGYTKSAGGLPGIILLGGYLGSIVFGNILLRLGARHGRLASQSLMVLAVLMALAGIIWFESLASTALLFAFAALLWILAARTNWDQDVLLFLGIATVLYILQDYRVGPGSDLVQYERLVGLFPTEVWRFVWLAGAIAITVWNLNGIIHRRSVVRYT